MRYRKLDKDYDMTFGHGGGDYYHDVPEMVAQNILTRLRLFTKEWFLDDREGTPYRTEVLGKYTRNSYANALRRRIIQTNGVLTLDSFDYYFDGETRTIHVDAEITTIYGNLVIAEAFEDMIPMWGI